MPPLAWYHCRGVEAIASIPMEVALAAMPEGFTPRPYSWIVAGEPNLGSSDPRAILLVFLVTCGFGISENGTRIPGESAYFIGVASEPPAAYQLEGIDQYAVLLGAGFTEEATAQGMMGWGIRTAERAQVDDGSAPFQSTVRNLQYRSHSHAGSVSSAGTILEVVGLATTRWIDAPDGTVSGTFVSHPEESVGQFAATLWDPSAGAGLTPPDPQASLGVNFESMSLQLNPAALPAAV